MIRKIRSVAPHIVCIALVTVAVVRAATAPLPPDGVAASAEVRRAVFSEIAAEEPEMRAKAAHNFPGDTWSQDDDFHHSEQARARVVAVDRGTRLSDVMRALDEGMREEWPLPPGIVLKPGVPPCRPRLTY
jgi:hypothetical protein